jgi:phenylacetate-coenzyme A ligase PaaK-like adenylate-forming protein
MTGLIARAVQQAKLAVAIHELLPPRASDVSARMEARNHRFRRLLHHAFVRSPFYRKTFRGIDLNSCEISDLPILTKAEMMENLDAIFTDRELRRSEIECFISEIADLGVLYKGKYVVCHTSGSQGQPALIVQDADAILTTFAAQIARGVKVQRRFLPHIQKLLKPARMAIITQKPGFYASSIFFSFFPAAARRFLKLERLSVFDPSEHLVDRLNAFQPNFITAYASTLELLAREKIAGRLHLGECLQQMTNISEPLPEGSARKIEAAFGVHVSNVYSVAECMALTCGCPVTHGNHLNSELAMLEVVDTNNRPVPNGTAGSKVLLTNLYNFVQPIIRYEIDDIVRLSPSTCACGSFLPHIQSVEGRMKDQLWMVARGKTHNPYYLFQAAMQYETNLAEHQILQTGFNTFVLRAAPQYGRPLSSAQLRKYVHQTFAAEDLAEAINLNIEIVDRILPEESGKVRRARNLFAAPPGDPSAPH